MSKGNMIVLAVGGVAAVAVTLLIIRKRSVEKEVEREAIANIPVGNLPNRNVYSVTPGQQYMPPVGGKTDRVLDGFEAGVEKAQNILQIGGRIIDILQGEKP